MAAEIEQLKKRILELEATRGKGGSAIGEKVLALLEGGIVSAAQLREFNSKYPSDGIYYARQILKKRGDTRVILTIRSGKGAASYMLSKPEAEVSSSVSHKEQHATV